MPVWRRGTILHSKGTRMTESSRRQPFAGIRILDFTRYVAGPFGT